MIINIYHTNDIHSNFEFFKKVKTYLDQNKGPNDLYFDSGDFADLKDIIVESDRGQTAFDLFFTSKCDMFTLGNNEIDLGADDLSKVLKQNSKIISTNLTTNDDTPVDGLKKSEIVTVNGIKFLIVGAQPYYDFKLNPNVQNVFFMMGNLKTHEPIEAINNEILRRNGEFDFVVFLSHLGYAVDKFVVPQLIQADLVLGAHSHDIVNEGNYSQSGKGQMLGKIVIEIFEKKIYVLENSQINLDNIPDSDIENKFEIAKENAIKKLSEEISMVENLEFDPYNENRLINFICDAMLDYTKSDFAIMHNGICNDSLIKPLSNRTLLENIPSKLNVTTYKIKGEKILEAVKSSLDIDFISQDGKGAGFRGTVLGTLGFSHNVELYTNPLKVIVDGTELDLVKEYKIVTSDYLQRGTYYTSLKVPNSEANFDINFIRDIVRKYKDNKKIFEQSKITRKK